jgi:predicted TPR repeat methyltransferase
VSECQCQGIESTFDRDLAASQLRRLQSRGPQRTTALLVEALRRHGVAGKTAIDVGGGVGAIPQALLASDAAFVTDVDASSAYLETARTEAQRLGYGPRSRFLHGNFVDLAPGLEPADIVTLDRVICCFDDMEALVGSSADKARALYGLVYPSDTLLARIGVRVANAVQQVRGRPFRIFAHSSRAVESIVEGRGLSRIFHATRGIWQVTVYARAAGAL